MTGEDSTSVTFCASHRDIKTGEPHGHTWHVEIFWPAEPFRDARAQHAWLFKLTAEWDGRLLEDVLNLDVPATNYAVGACLLNLSQCHAQGIMGVRVSRDGRVPCACEVRW